MHPGMYSHMRLRGTNFPWLCILWLCISLPLSAAADDNLYGQKPPLLSNSATFPSRALLPSVHPSQELKREISQSLGLMEDFQFHSARSLALPLHVFLSSTPLRSPQNCSQTAPTAFLACRSTEFQCDDRVTCINKRWLCDGEQDCPRGEDETQPNCKNITCRPDQFQCRDRTCIAGIFECSGKAECADGSDELNCSKCPCVCLIGSN